MTVEGEGAAPVRLGVTGHRAHGSDPGAVARLVAAVLDAVGPAGHLVTSLAEGTDRLLARAADERGWARTVVLPLEAGDYESDFSVGASRAEFRDLLLSATTVDQVPPARSRDEAYLAAGFAVLDRVDGLIAVWDGRPARGRGGTAEVVEESRLRGMPLAWIHVARPISSDQFEGVGALPPPGAVGASSEGDLPSLTLERWPWAR